MDLVVELLDHVLELEEFATLGDPVDLDDLVGDVGLDAEVDDFPRVLDFLQAELLDLLDVLVLAGLELRDQELEGCDADGEGLLFGNLNGLLKWLLGQEVLLELLDEELLLEELVLDDLDLIGEGVILFGQLNVKLVLAF